MGGLQILYHHNLNLSNLLAHTWIKLYTNLTNLPMESLVRVLEDGSYSFNVSQVPITINHEMNEHAFRNIINNVIKSSQTH